MRKDDVGNPEKPRYYKGLGGIVIKKSWQKYWEVLDSHDKYNKKGKKRLEACYGRDGRFFICPDNSLPLMMIY